LTPVQTYCGEYYDAENAWKEVQAEQEEYMEYLTLQNENIDTIKNIPQNIPHIPHHTTIPTSTSLATNDTKVIKSYTQDTTYYQQPTQKLPNLTYHIPLTYQTILNDASTNKQIQNITTSMEQTVDVQYTTQHSIVHNAAYPCQKQEREQDHKQEQEREQEEEHKHKQGQKKENRQEREQEREHKQEQEQEQERREEQGQEQNNELEQEQGEEQEQVFIVDQIGPEYETEPKPPTDEQFTFFN